MNKLILALPLMLLTGCTQTWKCVNTETQEIVYRGHCREYLAIYYGAYGYTDPGAGFAAPRRPSIGIGLTPFESGGLETTTIITEDGVRYIHKDVDDGTAIVF